MTKDELISRLAKEASETKATVAGVINAIEKVAQEILADDQDFPLPGLGKLSSVQKAERQGRNPLTGEAITIKARKAVKFTPSKSLKDALNK